MKMIQKLIRSALALSMAVQLLAVPALAAEDTPVYLALGDSISTGHGLAAPVSENFVELVNGTLGYKLENRALDGNTADGIYQQLTDPSAEQYIPEELLTNADIITITCGGNDVMNALYGVLLGEYNAKNGTNLQREDLPAIMAGTGPISIYKLALGSMSILDETILDRPECQQAIRDFETHQSEVMAHIRKHNPTASVIVTTQYNPYKVFEAKTLYKKIYQAVTPGLDPTNEKSLNYVIHNNAQKLGYVVSDVHAAFAPNSAELCNAFHNDITDTGLDFHPNAKGHKVIAQTILDTLDTLNRNLDETEFSLVSSNLNKGTVTVTGTGVYSSIAVAFYNSDEKMVGFDMEALNGSEGQTTLSAKLSDTAVKGKVFLFQRGSLIPHSEAIPF